MMNSPQEPLWKGLRAYGDMAAIATVMIKRADPDAVVISGGFLSPSSSRDSSTCWKVHFTGVMKDVFGQGGNSFLWPIAPDVYHWHPYDAMMFDEMHWSDREDFYDPLVMDYWDLMYLNRPNALPPTLDDIFSSSIYPNWEMMPQYCLEYCPTYSLSSWRSYSHPDSIPDFPEKFFTDWRANYQIVSSLCLIENDRDIILAPQVPQSHWWVEDWNPFGLYNVPAEDFTNCDLAWKVFMNKLLSMEFTGASSQAFISDLQQTEESSSRSDYIYHVKQWQFETEVDESKSLFVLRTYRNHWNDVFFLPEVVHTYDLNVDSDVAYAILYDMYGTSIGTYFPENLIISLPINGFIRYAEVFPYVDQFAAIVKEISPFNITARCYSNVLHVTSSHPSVNMSLFDITGRKVFSLSPDETSTVFRICTDNIPIGVYFVHAISDEGLLASSKVVVVR